MCDLFRPPQVNSVHNLLPHYKILRESLLQILSFVGGIVMLRITSPVFDQKGMIPKQKDSRESYERLWYRTSCFDGKI